MVAVIGGFTAIFAATMGLASNDIKRVLAYSTVSQLGYMMLALGAGSLAAGMFHLFTHAFFKALLFLAAGSVIHAVGTNDITEMGGLRASCRAPTGRWPSAACRWPASRCSRASGRKTRSSAPRPPAPGPILLAFGVITVFLTAFYTFRMFFLTFHGTFRGPSSRGRCGTHPPELDAETHRRPARVRLVDDRAADRAGHSGAVHRLLGLAAAEQRLPALSGRRELSSMLQPNLPLAVVGAVLAIAGIGVAWVMYGARQFVDRAARCASGPSTPCSPAATTSTSSTCGSSTSWPSGWAMRWPSSTARCSTSWSTASPPCSPSGGRALRTAQTGRVQNYGLVLFGGMAVIALVLVIVPLVRP